MALIGQAVSEEKIFEIVDGRTTDGRTPDHGHPISSPCESNGSGELITKMIGVLEALYSIAAKFFLKDRAANVFYQDVTATHFYKCKMVILTIYASNLHLPNLTTSTGRNCWFYFIYKDMDQLDSAPWPSSPTS